MGQCILIKPTNNYTHPSTHPATMITQDAGHRFTTDTEKSNWNGKAAGNHTHSYLPLAGGTMTGDLKVKAGDFLAIPIKIYPGDVNGAGLVSQAGGLYIAGSGESAQSLYTTMGINAATERTFITSDNDISLVTNCQTISNRKTVTIDVAGKITAPGGFSGAHNPADLSTAVPINKGGTGATTAEAARANLGAAASSHGYNNYSTATSVKNYSSSVGYVASAPSGSDNSVGFMVGRILTANKCESFIMTGRNNIANNMRHGIISGLDNKADWSGYLFGVGLISGENDQTVVGMYNVQTGKPGLWSSLETYFVVGGGGYNSRKNIFRVSGKGIYSSSTYNTSGADYAEYFEWLDGNPDKQDHVGYFVTLDGDKIKIANEGDYILGVVSSTPSVIGNSYDDQWFGMEILDDWGRPIMEEYTEPAEYIDQKLEDGTIEHILVHPKRSGMRPKINPGYDNTKPYVGRSERPEWSPVGMLGVLRVRDDGTCEVNGYCTVADGGIATTSNTGYRVIKRVTDNIIKILFR